MKLGLLIPPTALLVTLALAPCSGGEGPLADDSAAESSPEPVVGEPERENVADLAEEASRMTETTDDAVAVDVAMATPTAIKEVASIEEPGMVADPTPARRTRRIAQAEAALSSWESWVATLPTVEFPDDVALLAHHWRMTGTDRGATDLVRIYRTRAGEVVRETLFAAPARFRECRDADISFADLQEEFGERRAYEEWIKPYYSVDYSDIQTLAGQLPECGGGYSSRMMAKPDASSIIMTVCIKPDCFGHLYPDFDPDDHPPGRTALYESQDGGITWGKLAAFDVPWIPSRHLPSEDGETRLLLEAGRPLFKDADGRYTEWLANMVWPSSGGIEELPDPPPAPESSSVYLDDGRECWLCLPLPDGRVLLSEYYDVEALIGPYGAAEGQSDYKNQDWPTILDPETGEQWPVRLPRDVLKPGYALWLTLAIQRGPFLQVTGVDGCLPVLAEPSASSEELACMAERVLLTDLAEASEADGRTWHSVRTPAGVVGWADGRYLE